MAGVPGGDAVATLLVVEDEPILRRLLHDVLSEHGFRVLVAGDATEALDMSTNEGRNIDLVITDVVLPGRNGPALANALRARHPTVRFVYISGFGDDELHGRGLPPDAAFVPKPFTAEELVSRVNAALADST